MNGPGQDEVAQVKRQDLIPVSIEMIPDLFCAQHTYTPACDGWHAPGPCPPSQQPELIEVKT